MDLVHNYENLSQGRKLTVHVAKSHAEDGQAHYVYESEMEKFLEGSGDVLPQKFGHIK